MDWSSLIERDVSPIALIARGSCFHWFLFLTFRFVMRRDVGGGIGVADVLPVVLIADARPLPLIRAGRVTGAARRPRPGGLACR
jgi:hypothetical protein